MEITLLMIINVPDTFSQLDFLYRNGNKFRWYRLANRVKFMKDLNFTLDLVCTINRRTTTQLLNAVCKRLSPCDALNLTS